MMSRFVIVLAGLTTFTASGYAQAPAAKPNSPYAITPEVGAWTICAASFTGEVAGKRAHDLVTELRTHYRLPAYLFNRGEELRREQDREVAERRRERQEYLRRQGINPEGVPIRVPRPRIEDQYAVLVGGYKDMETARKELERIKKLPTPKSVPVDTILQTSADDAGGKQPKEQRTAVNPFGTSFVARNPTVPTAREDAAKADPFLKQLNAGEKRSLLKCKQPVTLLVREFHGATVFQPKDSSSGFMEKLFGGKGGDQLSAAADNANSLAEALNKAGFADVYVLHTRNSSIVTVGAFARPDDPKVEQTRQILINRFKVGTSDTRMGAGFELIGYPMPIPVPQL